MDWIDLAGIFGRFPGSKAFGMRILAVTVFEIYLLAETQTRNPCPKTYLAQKRGRGGVTPEEMNECAMDIAAGCQWSTPPIARHAWQRFLRSP